MSTTVRNVSADALLTMPKDGFRYELVKGELRRISPAGWVVSPKRRSVTVYRSMTDVKRLSESDELEGGDVVTGFRCKVSEIFV